MMNNRSVLEQVVNHLKNKQISLHDRNAFLRTPIIWPNEVRCKIKQMNDQRKETL